MNNSENLPLGLGGAAIICLISFLSLVDLFGPHAIGPTLTELYGVTPSKMGFAINATTIGMAVAGLMIALVSRSLDRRKWIWSSLMLLVVPTVLLAFVTSIEQFIALRVIQGLLMSVAFTLTMGYLSENFSEKQTATAMAAYITGNVMSNLLGRLLSAYVADTLGINAVFYTLAVLDFCGAILAIQYIGFSDKNAKKAQLAKGMSSHECMEKKPHFGCSIEASRVCGTWYMHLFNPKLLVSFIIGFILLFVFIGVYTYVNYVLASSVFALSPAVLGLVYFVFIPAVFTTPMAGRLVVKLGVISAYWLAMLVSIIGLMSLLSSSLVLVLLGLALVAVGVFFAQAVITGFVGQAATTERVAASGLYLSSYYFGGMSGSIVMGKIFEAYGWNMLVFGAVAVLVLSALLALNLKVKCA